MTTVLYGVADTRDYKYLTLHTPANSGAVTTIQHVEKVRDHRALFLLL